MTNHHGATHSARQVLNVSINSRHIYYTEIQRQLDASKRIISRLKIIIEDANVECIKITEELLTLVVESSSDVPDVDGNQDSSENVVQPACCSVENNQLPHQSAEFSQISKESLKNENPIKEELDEQLSNKLAIERLAALEASSTILKKKLTRIENEKLAKEEEWTHQQETVATDLRVIRGLLLALPSLQEEGLPNRESLTHLLEECEEQLEELRSQHSALDAFFVNLDKEIIEATAPSDPDLNLPLHKNDLLSKSPNNDSELSDADKSLNSEISSVKEKLLDEANSKAVPEVESNEASSSSTSKRKGSESTSVVQKQSHRTSRLIAVMSGAATTVNGLFTIVSGAAATLHGLVSMTTSSAGAAVGAVGVANGALVSLNGLAGVVGGVAATLTGRVGLVRGAVGAVHGLTTTAVGTAGMISGVVGAATSSAGTFTAMVNIVRGTACALGGVAGVVRGTASTFSAAFADAPQNFPQK